MTCIVAVASGGKVWMGGDSFSGNGSYAALTKHPKVTKRRVGGGYDILIGSSGDHRGAYLVNNMLMPSFNLTELGALDYVAGPLVNAMRDCFKENGYLESENSKERHDCQFLVGLQGRIFSVWDNFDVMEAADNYWAMGSGLQVALGCLFDSIGDDPYDRVHKALLAAEYHTAWVRRPFHVEQV